MRKSLSALLFSILVSGGVSAQTATKDAADYTDGVFILNEDWYGHNNSTVNFITSSGEWIYRVIQKENPGLQLGGSACFGTIYGGRYYIISKQDKDSATDIQGAQITVCDARTMKVIKQIKEIDTGVTYVEGRGFLAVNDSKAYVGTNNGIYILDLVNLEIKGKIEGTENSHTDPYGRYYLEQTGSILRINEKVYALNQERGLMVIDPETDKLLSTTSGPDNGKLAYGSAVMSKDGSLWMSVSDKFGNGKAYDFLMKYNPATGDTTRVDIPEGMTAPSNSWYAWTPDGFCASTRNNVLYWNAGNGVRYTDNRIYKYDIDKNEVSLFIDFESEDLKIYASSMRMDPVNDILYLSVFKDQSIPTFMLRKYDNKGNKIAEYAMEENYWFPTIPVFPDNAMPVANSLEAVEKAGSEKFEISLDNVAEDADNMKAAMIKTITDITDRNVIGAEIINGNLVVTPLKDGSSTVILNVNSNGNSTAAEIAVNITGFNGIESTLAEMRSAYVSGGVMHIDNCSGFRFTVYGMSGNEVDSFTASSDNYTRSINVPDGLYIIRGTNGSSEATFKLNIR